MAQSKDADKGKPRSKKPLIIVGVVVLVGRRHRIHILARAAQSGADGRCLYRRERRDDGAQGLRIRRRAEHRRQQYVKQGDLLLRIDAQDYLTAQAAGHGGPRAGAAQLKSARGRLADRARAVSRPARLGARAASRRRRPASRQAQRQYERQHEVDRRATTQENIDAATSQQSQRRRESGECEGAGRRSPSWCRNRSGRPPPRWKSARRSCAQARGAARPGRFQFRLHRSPRAERRVHHAAQRALGRLL